MTIPVPDIIGFAKDAGGGQNIDIILIFVVTLLFEWGKLK